jgi:hypothetical protein
MFCYTDRSDLLDWLRANLTELPDGEGSAAKSWDSPTLFTECTDLTTVFAEEFFW